jgi:hypothetical protein
MNPPFPGKCEGVLCIGVADDYVKAGAGINYFHFGKRTPKEALAHQEGSSVATAFASGFTALILQCLQISKYGRSPSGEWYRITLQDYQELQQVFKDKSEDGKFITVPLFLPPKIFGANDCIWIEGKADLDNAVHKIIK